MAANPILPSYTYYVDPNTLQQTTLTLPTYDSVPTGCAVGPFIYQLLYSGPFPTWMTDFPTLGTGIVFGTTDINQVGSYTFTLIVVDNITGLSNNEVVFTVDVQIMKATSITVATTPPDTTYLIGSGMTPISLPTYTWFPVESQTTFTKVLVGAPAFVTIGGAPDEI